MEKVKPSDLIHFILNIISFCFLITACFLIFFQTIKNMYYNYSDNKTILAEKLVYQQFSHNVYSNINNKIYYQLETIPYSEDCPEGKEILQIPIKLDSYYDCENIKNNELNEDICQNKISKSSICCQNDCCENNIYLKQTICREKNYNNIDNEENNDIRKNICQYFNVYNGKFSKILNSKICAKRYDLNYEDLLYVYNDNNCVNISCIYFDTKNHCICDINLKENNLLFFGQSFLNLNLTNCIVKNIFSEINPNFFEYETILKESLLNNKIKINKKEKEKVNMLKVIHEKNIYDAFFKDKNDIQINGNEYYINQTKFLLSSLTENNEEYIFKNYLENEYMKIKSIKWYTRNYIGFKDYNELAKFQIYFDEKDPMNNPLYKITNIIYPNWESIIILFLFLLTFILAIIYQIYIFFKEKNITNILFLVIDIFRQISLIILLIIYLPLFLFRYNYTFFKIDIDMEIYYKIVLEKYNERRGQKLLFTGVIILCINFAIELANYIIMIFKDKNNGINTISKYTIIIKVKNSYNNEIIPFKFYLNRKFSDEIKRFKQKFLNDFDIDECKNEDIIIDQDKDIKDLKFINEPLIFVICEKKE